MRVYAFHVAWKGIHQVGRMSGSRFWRTEMQYTLCDSADAPGHRLLCCCNTPGIALNALKVAFHDWIWFPLTGDPLVLVSVSA
jgi:hypothetical protein